MRNVFIITSEYPPEPGGIGNHAFNLAHQLDLAGYQLHVFTEARTADEATSKQFDGRHNIQVTRVNRRSNPVLSYYSRVRSFLRFLGNSKTDDVIISSGKSSLWLVGLFARKRGIKKIAVVHGSEVLLPNKQLRKFTCWCLSHHNEIVAVSHFTSNLLKQQDVKLESVVINNGYSLETGTLEESSIAGSPSLITVGSVTARKGQINVINALPEVIKKYPDVHYHIVGIPQERDVCLARAKALEIESHITFHGAISQPNLLTILNNSDVFLMLSQNLANGDVEGFGIAVIEANSIGLPAIGGKNTGIADAISDKHSGILVDPYNASEISEAVATVLENYSFYSTNAKQWSHQFRWENIVKHYIQLIEA